MKTLTNLMIAGFLVFLSGCSTGVVSMGKDTYMVAYRGTDLNTMYGLKAQCLKSANEYCEKQGLAMVVVSTSGHDGNPVPFDDKPAVCELIFKAVPTNSPQNVAPVLDEEHLEH